MNGNRIAGVSRFGRLRKTSKKLLDSPERPLSTTRKTSKGKRLSIQKRSARKLHANVMVDPFKDFEPNSFNELLSSGDTTDTSSSVGENDENGTKSETLNTMVTRRRSPEGNPIVEEKVAQSN